MTEVSCVSADISVNWSKNIQMTEVNCVSADISVNWSTVNPFPHIIFRCHSKNIQICLALEAVCYLTRFPSFAWKEICQIWSLFYEKIVNIEVYSFKKVNLQLFKTYKRLILTSM
jgi:hypothetical protein